MPGYGKRLLNSSDNIKNKEVIKMTETIICPKCNHKSMYFEIIDNTYRCNHCGCLFNKDLNELQKDTMGDSYGNRFNIRTEKEGNLIHHIITYHLEPGKTTLRGSHPKLKPDEKCAHPERNSCNNEIFKFLLEMYT